MAQCGVTNQTIIDVEKAMRGILAKARLRKLDKATQQKQFQSLIENYKEYITEDIAEIFEQVSAKLGINTNEGIFFSKQSILNILTQREDAPYENKTNIIQDVEKATRRKEVRDRSFMLNAYKDATSVRQKVEKEISVALGNALLLNRIDGKAVNTTNAMNQNIRNYQQQLLNKIAKVIVDNLQKQGRQRFPNVLRNPIMYENGKYTGAVEEVLKYDNMLNFTADQLIEYSNNSTYKELLDAYNAKVILTHFDSLMASKYGKNIVIKNFGDGNFSYDNKYSWNTKGNSMTDGFANPEEMVIESLIPKKMQELITITPLLYYGSNDKVGYLQVSDFSNTIGRLKEFAWNGHDYIVPESLLQYLEHDSTKALAQQYSLVEMINRTRKDGSIFFPAIFEILSTPTIYNNIKSTHPELLKNFPPQYERIVYSIYKGIFSDSGNSVNAITKNKLSRTLYNDIVELADSIFIKKFMQYREYDNVIIARDMINSNYDQNERLIRSKINTINSKLIKRFQNIIDNDFKLTYENDMLSVEKDGKLLGRILHNGSIKELASFEDMQDLISKVLGIAVTDDLIKAMPNDNIIENQQSLQNMALRSLYLAWVNNKGLDASKYIILENSSSIKKNMLGELDLIHPKDVNTIQNLATAVSIIQGVLSSSQVRDGFGNARAISGLSYLIGSINSQLELQNKQENSSTRNSLYVTNPGIFKGIYDSKEVVTTQNGAKTSTEWNVGEFITSGFLYDYIGGLSGGRNSLLQQGVIAILASVNSDKNTISKLLVDLNANIPQFNKALGQMTNYELVQLINKEFGDIYINTYNNIENDLNTLFDYLGVNLHNQYLNNFKEFKEFGFTVKNLQEWIREYNHYNREEPIHLIDQVHYRNNNGNPEVNQTLFSLIARFNPQFLTEKGVDISKYPTSIQFWNYKSAELIQSLFAGKFNIDFSKTSPQIQYLRSIISDEWVDSQTNQMIFAKVKYNNKTLNLVDSESEYELRSLLNISENADLTEALHQAYNNNLIEIKLNPEIGKYNLLDYFASQEHMLCTVGSHIAHPAKGAFTNETSLGLQFLYEEAARFQAQHKRNVSFTATMSEFTLGLRNGIPDQYNVAIIDDINDVVHTIGGTEEVTKPFDGATFVNPFVVYLENNSLGSSRVGFTKKQFVHAYDHRTGTGIIIKTAGFALTNNFIRNSELIQRMNQKMTDRIWDKYYDITKDENGKRIIYGIKGQNGDNYLYYKQGSDYFSIRTSGIKYLGEGKYSFPIAKVNRKGIVEGDEILVEKSINSNYQLWEAFGGYNSAHLTNKGLVWGEDSIEATVEAINNVAEYRNGKLYQPLKISDIHYVATAGAVKQGAANINSKSAYYDDTPLDFMKINMYQAGVQLDKEHHADNSELALMTQVISACAHLGYTAADAGEIYNALYTLTQQGTKDLLGSFKQYLGQEITQKDFASAIINTVFKQIATQNVDENNLITTIASDLVEKVRKGKKLTNEEALSLPVDDNAIYNQFISKLAVFLTDSGIRMKIPGILSVLNPSYDTIKLYEDRKLEEVSDMQALQDEAPYVVNQLGIDYSALKFGRTYSVKFKLPTFTLKAFSDGRFASTDKNGNIFYRNTPVQVDEFFDYIQGKTNTATSIQKQEVFRRLQNKGFNLELLQELIQTPEDVQKFILWHEESHQSRPEALKSYYSEEISKYGSQFNPEQINWMSSNKLAEELQATLDAAKKLLWEKHGINLKLVKDRADFRRFASQMEEAVENVTVGRNLGSYDATFIYNNQTYSIWDFDSVQALYAIRDASTIEDLKNIVNKYKKLFPILNDQTFNLLQTYTSYSNYLEKLIRRQVRHDSAMLSTKRSEFFDDTSVYVDGNLLEVDLSTVNITPYEFGMSKSYVQEFGLDENTSVYEISHNTNYFTERILENIKSKVSGLNWDYCLKRLNGNHLYILDESNLAKTEGLSEVEFTRIIDNGNVYRTNEMDENMYQMQSEEDKVFTDGTNEIIVTKHPEWYINKSSYNILSINPLKDALNFEKALMVLRTLDSNNHGLDRYLNYLGDKKGDWFTLNQAIESPTNNNQLLLDMYTKLGQEVWVSFMLTLDAVVSRTPSQSMQSVMAMKIGFFDNMNLNNVFVASDQFFLQGSDLDIDAASIALYGVAKNGKVPLWSPFSDYTINPENPMLNIKKSMNLPFPTGNKATQIQYNSNQELYTRTVELYNKYRHLFTSVVNKDNVKFFNNFSGQLDLLKELILDINQNGIPILNDAVSNKIGEQIDLDKNYVVKLINTIEKTVNKHNLYLETQNAQTVELIAKNYNMYKMFSIINDPINLLQAQSSVDVMTATAKKVANQSPSANLAKNRTPGNFINKYESIRDNQVGSKGIGICAVGLKGFFGLTQYSNTVINEDINALERLRLGKQGKQFYIPRLNKVLQYDYLANINPSKKSPLYKIDQNLYRKFKEKGFDNDAALQLSALLSLATDNAKELALAKLNASDKTLGMYIYGLSIGMEFEDVASILMSPVGLTLTSVMEGNIFNNNSGLFNLNKVFDYFEAGPNNLIKDNKIGFTLLVNALVSGRTNFSELPLQLAKYAWTHTQLPEFNTGSQDFFKAYRQYKSYFRQVQMIKNNISTYNSLKELYFGADEMRHLGSIFSLNQGLNTKISDIIGRINDIEKIFINRADLINSESRRQQIHRWFTDYRVNLYPYSSSNRDGYKVITPTKMSLNEFIQNPNELIKSYDTIKHSFNILDAVNTVPHFRGYFEMLNLLDQALKNVGHRYSTVRTLLDVKASSRASKDELTKLSKKLDWFYSDYLINEWMLSEDLVFNLPNGARVFTDDILNQKYTDKGGNIILGTNWGNASFKYYIENILVPQLQSDPQFKSNIFIKSLQPDIVTLTVDNIPRVYLATGINMMPSTEAERALFNEYKAAFNSIADTKVMIGNKPISLRNAMYLYGLIAHYGKQGRNSLMPIFENQHNRELVDNFHKFQSKFEGINQYNSQLTQTIDNYIIPYKSPYQAFGEPYIYWKNEYGEVIKWRKASYEELNYVEDDVNGYIPQSFKYADDQVRNYDMNTNNFGISTLNIGKNKIIIENGKFKNGKLKGLEVPYQVDPISKQKFIDENEIENLLNKLNCK